jgi:pimeloyl-ACP methyl ester carboxylesterase
VFVHGGAGSGAQFESQAMRFTSNGYTADDVRVLEYNSTNRAGFGAIPAQLDALIAELRAETGVDQVDLLGHSLGTGLMQAYLANPARAANVAHYVNIDGSTAPAPPGGVETLALWGRGSPTRRIVGAENVYLPDQSHVQVATSRESFGAMYRFFNDGEEPKTLDIEPEPSGVAQLAGRVVNFPANSGITAATLDIFEVDPETGARRSTTADATYDLPTSGAWGPFSGKVGASYELAVTRDDAAGSHHFYSQPLVRSDHLVRLNSSPPDAGIGALIERGDGHSAFVVTRYKEFWGEHPTQRDTLEIDGTNVLNAATAPVTKNAIGVFAFDAGSDGVSNTSAPLATLFGLPFITGVDKYIPAASPPDRVVTVRSVPRGDTAHPQVVNVPNWASTDHAVSVLLNDYVQPSDAVAYSARFSAAQCASIARLATGGRTTADIVRLGVEVLHDLAASGTVDLPPATGGPCTIVTTWPAAEAERIGQTAAAFGVTEDELHHTGGWLVLAIIYYLATHGT